MHRAFIGLLLLAPLCSTVGIQVVNFRLAFFAEAIGHSAFTGIALGFLLASLSGLSHVELGSMIGFGILVAVVITFYRRRSGLASDTVIGVFSSMVIALGLCVITHLINSNRLRGGGSQVFNFLMGNILTIRADEIVVLFGFFVIAIGFQFFAYNRLLFIGINASLAETRGVHVWLYEYGFAVLLALVVTFSIKAVGVLLVTAMLVIPAAAARNLAHSAGSLFWWGGAIAVTSAVGGLLVSDAFNSATGATTVLLISAWFVASSLYSWLAGRE
ncbi:MAG: metal ABC transporter permease [Planctomycetota bacterium]